MAQKETAEQKLLKIIEASKKAKAAASGAPDAAVTSLQKPAHQFSLNLRQVNLVLILFVILSACYLGYEFSSGVSLLEKDMGFVGTNKIVKDQPVVLVPRMKSIGYYLERAGTRNIFQPYEKKDETSSSAVESSLKKRMSKFKIVGIAWLDLPESTTVMLEDTSTHKTHFLKEGDKVEDFTVKTIYTDRVVFKQANEEITINL